MSDHYTWAKPFTGEVCLAAPANSVAGGDSSRPLRHSMIGQPDVISGLVQDPGSDRSRLSSNQMSAQRGG